MDFLIEYYNNVRLGKSKDVGGFVQKLSQLCNYILFYSFLNTVPKNITIIITINYHFDLLFIIIN